MKSILVTVLCLFSACYLFGQSGRRPATVALVDGTIVHGKIQPLARGITPQKVRLFLPSKEERLFSLRDIKSFEYIRHDGKAERFERHAVRVETSTHRLADLTQSATPIWRTDTMLIQALVVGKYNLYKLVDQTGKHLFFLGNDSIVPLFHKQYYGTDREGKYTRTKVLHTSTFRQQLGKVASGCPALPAAIANTDYNQYDLRKIVVALNECAGKTPSYQWVEERHNLEVSALLGGSFTRHTVDDYWTSITDVRYTGRWQPALGVGIVAYFPETGKRVAFYGEAMYRTSASRLDYLDLYGISFDFQQRIAIRYLRINTMGRLYVPIGRHRLFFQAGIANGFAVSNKNERTERGFDFRDRTLSRTVPTYANLQKWEIGLVGGTGFNIGRFSLEARYDRGSGFTRNRYDAFSRSQAYSLLLSYAFVY